MSDPIQGVTSGGSSTTAPANTGAAGTVEDRDTFLRLLTTQLANQDPASPYDSQQFVAQLATFAQVERLTALQSRLDTIAAGIGALNANGAADLVGKGALGRGDQVVCHGGDTQMSYHTDVPLTGSVLTITDASGAVVASRALGPLASGDGVATWDGRDNLGLPVADGTYTFSISGTDTAGGSIDVEERVEGVIDAVDYTTGTPLPSVGGVAVPMANIIRLFLA